MGSNSRLLPQQHKITSIERAERLAEVVGMLQTGVRSSSAIMGRFKVSRDTAIAYRNEAMILLQAENKGITRDNLRALEEGRLLYWIEWTQERIQASSEAEDKRDWMKRLEALLSRYHAITGLNEITINSNHTEKRIVFHLHADKQQPAVIDSTPRTN